MKVQTLGYILYAIGLIGAIVAEICGKGYDKLTYISIVIMIIGCILFLATDILCVINNRGVK